jgi:uncharacterized protein
MTELQLQRCTAFAGPRLLTSGTLAEVAVAAKRAVSDGEAEPVLIFDDATSHVVDIDFRGTDADVIGRITPKGESPDQEGEAARGRGRPKLGVVAREVTLLPRHWEWLATQPGGASAAVRRLVDEARQTSSQKDRLRQAKESAYRFMSAMAGNEQGFEEATRALFANDQARFTELTDAWPRDVRDHARMLAARSFA